MELTPLPQAILDARNARTRSGGDWAPPTADLPITTRHELLEYVGRYAGLEEGIIQRQLEAMLAGGRIESADPAWPWDPKKDFAPIAREFSRKPEPTRRWELTLVDARRKARQRPTVVVRTAEVSS